MTIDPAFCWGIVRPNGEPSKPPFLLTRVFYSRKDAHAYIVKHFGGEGDPDIRSDLAIRRARANGIRAVRVLVKPFGSEGGG